MNQFLQSISLIPWWAYIIAVIVVILIRDIFFNKRHTISHNFPFIGHFRYMLEQIGPELRQYIVANNREELPFNRSQRSWIYASAKALNNYQGFGTDQDQHSPGFVFINPAMMPYIVKPSHPNYADKYFLPSAKIIGESHNRKRPYRPFSIINISAMSFGSLSARAVDSLNKGAKMAGCYHNTGEGGLSPYHCNGADVVFSFWNRLFWYKRF